MPHTHHSHSGQFCNHAQDSLSVILEHMINVKQMTTIALTEHIGRPTEHLYPDEFKDGWTPQRLWKSFEEFLVEAKRLRDKYAVSHPQVQILIGFESEWIDQDPERAQGRIEAILLKHANTIDIWVGSVHHVHGEPIDYDDSGYQRALTKSAADEDALFCSFFDAQYELVSRLQPPVVGHFDLIRLKSADPDKSIKHRPDVWTRVQRNLRKIKAYGGVVEVNTSGLRKGLREPYPQGEIVAEWTNMGGLIILSDDSHGISHVGTHYAQALNFLKDLHISEIGVMQKTDRGQPGCTLSRISFVHLEQHPFWASVS